MCKCVLPPGDNPTAVNKYIISYQNVIVQFALLFSEYSGEKCGSVRPLAMWRLQLAFKTSAQAIALRKECAEAAQLRSTSGLPPSRPPLPPPTVESVSFVMMRLRGGGGCACVQFVVRTTQPILQSRLIPKLS